MPIPRRLRSLPSHELPGAVLLFVAATPRSRLLGLMGLRELSRDHALLLPRCRSVHTIGMRFGLDLIWVDAAGRVIGADGAVAPGRVRGCRCARAVVEARAGAGERVASALSAASGEGGLLLALARRSRATGGLLDQAGAERGVAAELTELR